jgi:hypothetical protein
VAARGSDLERSLRLSLTANRRQVRLGRGRWWRRVTHAGDESAVASEVLDAGLQRRRTEYFDAAGEGCFGGVFDRDDKTPDPRGRETPRHRQDAGDRADRSIERELAEERETVEPKRRVLGSQDGDRDRQVECALFPAIGAAAGTGDAAGAMTTISRSVGVG